MKLIVIDPRETVLASSADIHLQPIPGEDPTLLAGILNVIFEIKTIKVGELNMLLIEGKKILFN